MKFCCNTSLPFPNNPKDLDPSYDGSRFLGLFWKGKKILLITEEIGILKFYMVHFLWTRNITTQTIYQIKLLYHFLYLKGKQLHDI